MWRLCAAQSVHCFCAWCAASILSSSSAARCCCDSVFHFLCVAARICSVAVAHVCGWESSEVGYMRPTQKVNRRTLALKTKDHWNTCSFGWSWMEQVHEAMHAYRLLVAEPLVVRLFRLSTPLLQLLRHTPKKKREQKLRFRCCTHGASKRAAEVDGAHGDGDGDGDGALRSPCYTHAHAHV